MPRMTNRERIELVLHVHELLFSVDPRVARLGYELSRLRLDPRWDPFVKSARFRVYGRGRSCLELTLDQGYELDLIFVVQDADERDKSGQLTYDALNARRGDRIMWMKKTGSNLVEAKPPPDQGWIRVNPESREFGGMNLDDIEEEGPAGPSSLAEVPAEKVASLARDMKKRIIGQDHAVDALVESIQVARVGLRDPHRPVGAFVFTGRTGVGKTTTAKVLAEELMGDAGALIAIDCSEYAEDHEYSKLIGAPVGYLGHERGGFLTNAVRKRPFSVILFDEIEKASPKVHQLLLQIMDEGRLTDGQGRRVHFGETVVIMTSNQGVEEIEALGRGIGFGEAARATEEKRENALASALRKVFSPEFLGRVTRVINFKSLTRNHLVEIARLELKKLRDHFQSSSGPYAGVNLRLGISLCEMAADKVFGDGRGARGIKRAIETEILGPLTRKLLGLDPRRGYTALVFAQAGALVIQFKENRPPPREAARPAGKTIKAAQTRSAFRTLKTLPERGK